MAITIDWATKDIFIPRADLPVLSASPEIRQLDLDWFRLQLKALEETVDGMPNPDTHRHNTVVTLGGVNYARVVEIINGYSVTFENGLYAVNFVGANTNVQDVTTVNGVSIRPSNAAGLIVAETGVSGLTPAESDALLQNTADLATMAASMTSVEGDIGIIQTDITSLQGDVATLNINVGTIQVDISAIKNDILSIETSIGSISLDLSNIEVDLAFIKAIEAGEWRIENNQMIFFDGVSMEIARFDLYNNAGLPTNEDVYRRVPV